jgi:beta-phosphoglucomutase-like phosphatase (HAD superfamily)
VGIDLAVWRIHHRMGMSGRLFINALLCETEMGVTEEQVSRIQVLHAKPDPNLFLATAESPGVAIESAVVVGGSIWDLLAAPR